MALGFFHAVGQCTSSASELVYEKMAQLIFLNELSHPTGEVHHAVARQAISDLVDVLLRITVLLPRASLITAEPLATLAIGNSYSVSIWLNDSGVRREQARFLLGLGQRAPFRVVEEIFGDGDPGVTVYRNSGDVVEGIGLAHLYGGMPISFCKEQRWRVSLLTLDVEQLLETAHEHWTTEIRHASLAEHVQTNRNWIISLRNRNVENAKELCANREELFPYLEFGPRVETDLNELQPPAFLQVLQYLRRMNDAVEAWDPDARPAPEYPPNTTDESEARKPLCQFPAPGGGHAAFTWHGRYTPGPGRIHFRLERGPKRVILGYIGRKLGV